MNSGNSGLKDNTLLNYFSPESSVKRKLSTNNDAETSKSDSKNSNTPNSRKSKSSSTVTKTPKQKQAKSNKKTKPMSQKNKKAKNSADFLRQKMMVTSSSSSSSESEPESKSDDDDDDQPIKRLLEKNNIRNVEVLVDPLTPEKVAVLTNRKRSRSSSKSKKKKPDSYSDSFNPIVVVDLASSDNGAGGGGDDDDDKEPIAKKFSPSSSTSSNRENKKVHNSPIKYSLVSPMRKFLSGKSSNDKSSPKSENSKKRPEKLQTLKKNVQAKNSPSSFFKNAKISPQKRSRRSSSSSSSGDDTLPLSQVSKILSTKSNNSTPSNSTPPKLKPYSSKPSIPNSNSKFLDPKKMQEQRFKTVVSKLESLKSAAILKPLSNEKRAYYKYAQRVVQSALLTCAEIERISNETIKKELKERFEKEKIKKMTDEERKEYFRKKHQEDNERRRQLSLLERERYEDSDIVCQTFLPRPKPVNMSGNLPSSCFGDVLMITEFLRTFADFLKRSTTDSKLDVKPVTLMKALTSGRSGFELVSKIITVLLETLLQEIGPIELSTNIDEIDINIFTAAELARIVLRKIDNKSANDDDDSGDDDDDDDVDVSEKFDDIISGKLITSDIYDLSPENILQILNALIHRLLQTKILEDFIASKEEELSSAAKNKLDAMNDLKQYKASQNDVSKLKSAERESTPSSVGDIAKPPPSAGSGDTPVVSSTNALSLKHFYGKSDVVTTDAESNENKQSPAPPTDNSDNVDDMIFKVKNRRALAEQEKEKRKLEREILKKEQELSLKVSRVENANKRLDRLQKLCKFMFRLEPLGRDRYHSRYWFFPKSSPNLFVEKGWSSGDSPSAATVASPKKTKSAPFLESTFPNVEENAWYYYDSVEDVDALISALLTKGIRESRLHERLKTMREKFVSTFQEHEKASKENDSAETNGELMLVEFLREEIYSVECKISEGGLGGSDNIDVFRDRLDKATNLKEFGELLIETQRNVRPALLRGMMAVKKSTIKEEEEEEQDDEDEREEKSTETQQKQEDAKRTKRLENWMQAVRSCHTWSRMVVLFYMFKNCVMWEKSIDNARCNKCRKNKDDDKVILCENCNAGYHIYCLKPPLKKIPSGDWFCSQCKPPSARTRFRIREEEEIEETEPEHDDTCARCSEGSNDADGDLVLCSTCPCAFHQCCHEPPLKYTPRAGWRCCQCTKGIIIKRSLRKRRIGK